MNTVASFGLNVFFLSLAGFVEAAIFSLTERVVSVQIHVDFLLMIVIYAALRRGPMAGILAGFFAGALQDVISGDILGIRILVMTTVGYLAAYFHNRVFSDDVLSSLLVMAGAILVKLGLLSLVVLLVDSDGLGTLYGLPLLYGALLTLLLTPLFYWILGLITKAVPKRY